MKKHFIILASIILTISLTIVSCKKDKGCDGGNLCFSIEGTDVSVNAARVNLPNNRYRIYWQEGNDSIYKKVEVDIFGNTVAEYNITDNAGTFGDVGFQYHIYDNGAETIYQGTAGTLDLSSINGEEWSGTFSGTVSNGTSSFGLKDGQFSNIPLE